jgi:hypothetical protein
VRILPALSTFLERACNPRVLPWVVRESCVGLYPLSSSPHRRWTVSHTPPGAPSAHPSTLTSHVRSAAATPANVVSGSGLGLSAWLRVDPAFTTSSPRTFVHIMDPQIRNVFLGYVCCMTCEGRRAGRHYSPPRLLLGPPPPPSTHATQGSHGSRRAPGHHRGCPVAVCGNPSSPKRGLAPCHGGVGAKQPDGRVRFVGFFAMPLSSSSCCIRRVLA